MPALLSYQGKIAQLPNTLFDNRSVENSKAANLKSAVDVLLNLL
jgi:hypothetical protein